MNVLDLRCDGLTLERGRPADSLSERQAECADLLDLFGVVPLDVLHSSIRISVPISHSMDDFSVRFSSDRYRRATCISLYFEQAAKCAASSCRTKKRGNPLKMIPKSRAFHDDRPLTVSIGE
jgi:hypothetical protein